MSDISRESLRKVKYVPQSDPRNAVNLEIRTGYFHKFTKVEIEISEGNNIVTDFALIEDEKNGKLHEIEPQLVQFIIE